VPVWLAMVHQGRLILKRDMVNNKEDYDFEGEAQYSKLTESKAPKSIMKLV
jgi:hypothetical protein